MRIKEAAAVCGLTEKAIRLYEARGLIHPVTEEKNGRQFRDYTDDTIRDLRMIAILRRASFSLEQIGTMQDDPASIPVVFAAYRDEVAENAAHLTALTRAAATVEAVDGMALEEFTVRLATAMHAAAIALPAECGDVLLPSGDEQAIPESPSMPRFRFTTWDEEIPGDAKEETLRRVLKAYERRERILGALTFPFRWLGGKWQAMPKKIRRGICVAIPILLLLYGALYSFYWVTPVSFTVDGVLYNRGEPDMPLEPTTVTLDGELRRHLWRDDYFTGTFSVEGFTVMDTRPSITRHRPIDEERIALFFKDFRLYYEKYEARLLDEKGRYTWEWVDEKKRQIGLDGFRFIFGLEGDEEVSLVIAIQTPRGNGYHFNSATGTYLVAPATTQDDAEFLVRRAWDRWNERNPGMEVDE